MIRVILKGTVRQARVDKGNLVSMKCVGDMTSVMSVEFEPEEWTQYWDDVSGKAFRQNWSKRLVRKKWRRSRG